MIPFSLCKVENKIVNADLEKIAKADLGHGQTRVMLKDFPSGVKSYFNKSSPPLLLPMSTLKVESFAGI